MLTSLPVTLLLGTVLGFLAGMGIGGGSLLMLWLTAVLRMSQTDARSVNLLFFLPGALIACIFRRKQGVLDLKKLLPAIISACCAAGIFSFIGLYLNSRFLKKAFGILLLVTSIRELLCKSAKKDPRTG